MGSTQIVFLCCVHTVQRVIRSLNNQIKYILPGFKPWRSRYESVNYVISNYWFTYLVWKSLPRFTRFLGVNQASFHWDTAIWKCQNLQRNVWQSGRCPTQILTFLNRCISVKTSLINTKLIGILWISVCSFWQCESIVANPIIYRLVPRPSRFEIRQWCRRRVRIFKPIFVSLGGQNMGDPTVYRFLSPILKPYFRPICMKKNTRFWLAESSAV